MSDLSAEMGVRRQRMVGDQIAARGLRDEAVLAAMRSVPRHLFVPGYLEDEAYADTPLPIGYGQTISQPYMVALMTTLLKIDVRSKVLEVGSGSGYQTAVLAEVAGRVFAVELLAPLAEGARRVLTRLGYDNARTAIGDGSRGWHEQAPFDGILVAAAAKDAPHELLEQLADGGRLVIPLGKPHRDQVLTVFERQGDAWTQRRDVPCRFVPLLRDGEPEVVAGGSVAAGPIPSPGRRSWRIEGPDRGSEQGEAPQVKSVSARVSGRVQGVYFRASAAREGERLGLRGWVRNESDGSVSVRAQGASEAVDALLAWCRVGPPAAHVDRVEVQDAAADETLHGFGVR
jgi:protein-L-isoaspartate(D-aspartate) O-methyltransferase